MPSKREGMGRSIWLVEYQARDGNWYPAGNYFFGLRKDAMKQCVTVYDGEKLRVARYERRLATPKREE